MEDALCGRLQRHYFGDADEMPRYPRKSRFGGRGGTLARYANNLDGFVPFNFESGTKTSILAGRIECDNAEDSIRAKLAREGA